MLRKIKQSDMVGKTVKGFHNEGINVLVLEFTDGTSLELWTDAALGTPFGEIYGIFVEDHVPLAKKS